MAISADTETRAAKIAIIHLWREERAEVVGAIVGEAKSFVRRGAVLKPAVGHARKEQTPRQRETERTASLTDREME
jgi:hypothetical protein